MSSGACHGDGIRRTDSSRDLSPIELSWRSRPSSIREIRKRVAEYAEAGGADGDDVELAVAEAVGNAVRHAYAGRDDGVIRVRAEMDGPDRLVVEIADFGSGITTHARPRRAGLGLPIIGALADSIEVKSADAGTRIVLRFPRFLEAAPVRDLSP
jgi:anti-sigma regulatory factor (Ser/Thr protein kinase)